MSFEFAIRNERSGDIDAIARVTVEAFRSLPISDHTEHFIVNALRASGALTISLVAVTGANLIGHIAFSPVTISDGAAGWYGLGPVSVLPKYQRQGVGRALIEEGLSRLGDLDAKGCCLVGHPDYYKKFGFRHGSGLVCPGVPREVFFVLPFGNCLPQGEVNFHNAFQAIG